MNQERTGALIRRLRMEKGLTQRELAGRLGVSDKAVSKWERGLGCPFGATAGCTFTARSTACSGRTYK